MEEVSLNYVGQKKEESTMEVNQARRGIAEFNVYENTSCALLVSLYLLKTHRKRRRRRNQRLKRRTKRYRRSNKEKLQDHHSLLTRFF